ncbi:MAG: anti-sigma factor [Acidimicrobiales bacterium]
MTAEIHLSTGVVALDAVDADERADFDRHLVDCGACRRRLDGFAETTALLAADVAVPPPAGLRANVLAEIRTVRQDPPIVRSGDGRADAPDAADASGTHGGSARPPATTRRWLAAAAVVALVVAAVAVLTLGREPSADDLAAVLAAPDAQTYELVGEDGSTAQVVWSRQEHRAAVVAGDLRQPGDGSTYELWFVAGEVKHPATLFVPDAQGTVGSTFVPPVDDADVLAVTIEPSGGSPQPTGDIVMAAATA